MSLPNIFFVISIVILTISCSAILRLNSRLINQLQKYHEDLYSTVAELNLVVQQRDAAVKEVQEMKDAINKHIEMLAHISDLIHQPPVERQSD